MLVISLKCILQLQDIFIPTTPAKTDLKAQFSMPLSTISSCGVLITFGSPTDGTNGGLCFLASSMAGMIELSGNCPVFGNKLSCLSFADESAILDDDELVPVFRRS